MQKRILLIGSLPKSLVNFRGKLLEELSIMGHEVHACANEILKDQESCTKLKKIGVTIHSIPIERNGLNPIKDFITFLSIIKLYLRLRPNIVLSYTIKPVVWGGLAAFLFPRIKYFALITGLGYAFTGSAHGKRLIIKNIIKILYKISLKKASAVIFQNPDDNKEFINLKIIPKSKKAFIVNGSGVDLDYFRSNGFPEGKVIFLMISRLLRDKGVREFIEAGQIINRENHVANFFLLGDIDSNPDAISREDIELLTNSKWFKWMDFAEDVRPFINNCHVFVLPSYREGTPRTVLEAMSMERPIITTNSAGCKETVEQGGNGYLVPIKDPLSLSIAIKKFINNPEIIIQMGKKSRIIAAEKYDVNKVNLQMIKALGLLKGL